MKSINVEISVLAWLALLAGCSKEEPAKTVSWYREHADERKAVVAHCADDPGHLSETPNCVNARQAESIEGVGSLRTLPPLGLDPKRKPGFESDEPSKVRP